MTIGSNNPPSRGTRHHSADAGTSPDGLSSGQNSYWYNGYFNLGVRLVYLYILVIGSSLFLPGQSDFIRHWGGVHRRPWATAHAQNNIVKTNI